MPCYHPIPAEIQYESRGGEPPRRRMALHPKDSDGWKRSATHWLRCGKCLECREMNQQYLAIRIKHEARRHEHNQFLTLTYNENNVPDGLQKEHMTKFWKRLRYHIGVKKYLECGEYGDETHRPHYHAAALGLEINDLKKWDTESSRSETVEKIWGNGIVTISELTWGRMKYVAGYVLKKAGYRKQLYCTEEGEELEAPYRKMSQGLGAEWIKKYKSDLRNGYLQEDNVKYPIPRYYMDKIKETDPTLTKYIEEQKQKIDNTLTKEDRRLLNNEETIRMQQIKRSKRDKL